MPFLWQDRCRRILELKVRSSILVLQILKKLLTGCKGDVISWAMRKLGVEEWLVSAVMQKQLLEQFMVIAKRFEVKVGMHQVLFSSLAVLDPRVGHTMDILSPFIPVLCHSD